jgi:hypothetical protein
MCSAPVGADRVVVQIIDMIFLPASTGRISVQLATFCDPSPCHSMTGRSLSNMLQTLFLPYKRDGCSEF